MKSLRKILHWILFLISGWLITILMSVITFYIPFVIFEHIHEWNTFWFILFGLILLYIYKLYLGLVLYIFENLNKKKPDYWFSSIFLSLVAIYTFYNLYDNIQNLVNNYFVIFKTFKGIIFIITILPIFLVFTFFTIIFPFFNKPEERVK
jgi:hypothetical protein